MESKFKLSTSKTIATAVIYFFLFFIGDLLNSILFDFLFSFVKLPYIELYTIPRVLGCILVTYFLFWLYTTKVLHLSMKDFGITFNIRKWGVALSIFLPLAIIITYLLIGQGESNWNYFSVGDIVLISTASLITALRAGILEEIVFRGFIMRLFESRWNKYIAFLVPSFLFSLVHIPSIKPFTINGLLLLVISGTLVGIMFSLVAYEGKSISNSILMHSIWNFTIVTSFLHITTEQGAWGEPIFSIIIPANNILITGTGFGVEASIISITGYFFVCCAVVFIHRRRNIQNNVYQEKIDSRENGVIH